MSSHESVSHWIALLRLGQNEAAARLWKRYYSHLVTLARQRILGHPRRAADEEDVATSAFKSFCAAVEKGRFPDLHDRDDLWQVLLVITERKAFDLIERDNRLKRGAGRVLDEAALGNRDAFPGLDALPALDPDPAFAAEVADNLRQLLDRLEDDELRQIAILRMQGYTIQEIADHLGCIRRRIDRRLRFIRRIWSEEPDS